MNSTTDYDAEYEGFFDFGEDDCSFNFAKTYHLTMKLILFSIIGTILIVAGLLLNSINIYVFTRTQLRSKIGLILGALAVTDSFYLILVFFTKNLLYLAEHFVWANLYNTILRSSVICGTIRDICLTASLYLILAAAFNRFLAAFVPRCSKSKCCTIVAIVLVLVFAVAYEFVKFFELIVVKTENCPQDKLGAYAIEPAEFTFDVTFKKWADLAKQIFEVFLPVFFMLCCNIPLSFGYCCRRGTNASHKSREYRKTVAIMVWIVLFSSGIAYFLSLAPWLAADPTVYWGYYDFYVYMRDSADFIALFVAALKFALYFICCDIFREEILLLCGCRKSQRYVVVVEGHDEKVYADPSLNGHLIE